MIFFLSPSLVFPINWKCKDIIGKHLEHIAEVSLLAYNWSTLWTQQCILKVFWFKMLCLCLREPSSNHYANRKLNLGLAESGFLDHGHSYLTPEGTLCLMVFEVKAVFIDAPYYCSVSSNTRCMWTLPQSFTKTVVYSDRNINGLNCH